ncbi:LLM class flavin-dependent oxidoreductase [Tropicibacter naphthalenivorans]|uniref:Luciferase-like monooxygenase n=1 Tax=Tropicibacter naphthalenivorans TaxID=441103 RepID=A0A0P1GU57_9RHOB|nr:LLM class flavin-dependent oxidoreductase [Tropicibacter naphthalenivorans]CUH78090.1 Limonene 1,2-monooxygenase [Tropicibacter naphthalenivorans]SMC93765.1 luciferase family oxidoreductase, group 1 [Tropicibacter naphthalenivorans]
MHYSLLDLAPVPEGSEAAQALRNTGDLAVHAERWGYHRYWLAEHHNMPGIASAATAVLIGHVAGLTKTMRVGAGGIMLPNHAPLAVAEAFGTLATLYPGRIDLGLGRAPGGDHAVMQALGVHHARAENFPNEVAELRDMFGPLNPDRAVNAHPGAGTEVPLWVLGSSLYGAQVAAALGLPYAFASHFAPAALEQAFEVYRRYFQPSQTLAQPHAMLAVNLFAADTEAEAHRLRTSMQQSFYRLRTGTPGKLPAPVDDLSSVVPAGAIPQVNEALRITAVGTPAQVQDQLSALIAQHQPQEVILTGHIYDHAARLRSFEIGAEVMQALTQAQAA